MGIYVNGNGNLIPAEHGHVVINDSGTAFTQRKNLKFVGATVSDDSTNNATVVTVQGGGGNSESKSGTLNAGSTSITLTFTSETISTNTLVDIYTDPYGVIPIDVTTTSTTVTLVFNAQPSNTRVSVTITN